MSMADELDGRRTARRGAELGRADRQDRRVPPHNLDAEASVLGAMLLSRDAIEAAADAHLAADHFYKPAHGHIHNAVTVLHGDGHPVDPVTVADHLDRSGLLDAAGGAPYLLDLQATTPSTSNAARYARIIREHAQLRRLIAVAGDIAELGYSTPDDVPAAVDHAEELLAGLQATRDSGTVVRLADAYSDHLDLLEARYEGRTSLGAPTGLTDLDAVLGGLAPGQLITVASRPGVGKTIFGLGVATAAAAAGTTALFVSIEMTTTELVDRLTAGQARVSFEQVRTGKLAPKDWERIATIAEAMAAPILIDDDAEATVGSIRNVVRRHRSDNIGLIVIDYLQILDPQHPSGDRRVDVDELARGLKRLARQMEVPVIALAQLSRNLESRRDKRPMLSDLRESGQIEAESDAVIALYRDELYNQDSPDRGVIEAIVLKNRQGRSGVTVKAAFLGQYQLIANMANGSM